MFDTPILLVIFKRKDTALKVLEAIRKIKPKKLYIAADGWRNEEEKIKCIDTRESILKSIDWECEIKTLFQDTNLGCCNGVSKAITWFFDNEEQGIILEDDVLPEISFFYYCEKLLNYYKDNEQIMHIAGDSPLDRKVGEASYYFATIQHCWGWASWSRAWKYYDATMKTISFKDTKKTLKKRYNDFNIRDYWQNWFYRTADINTWDYQWTYCIISKDGICINPNVNLISNIGFGEDSTHTGNPDDENANRKTYPIDAEHLIHPKEIKCDANADFEIAIKRFNIKPFSLSYNITREIKRIIRQIKGLFIKKDNK
ncbi:putative nucleotide-diphospho-sugar transferase [Brachyspira intermedia PWS/A]|uniref:Putative nucleotide-diphospho-sugar transferase n=1 Tax=Brachyspira intermedia (strain ATCC 51140 / PWS/A) TaxID=1045858 RepID=G0EM70_BRAIP|nr:nucleotide-diphospho-sugar transferase [Brachyspira intermedia]AEM21639.1 putative nucleotide-diphospho-sugar transferase [Brachyspira intermedia PWS/A]